MRLKTIKLAGFKSFVDPTTFHMPSNLIGVVGPNGCGKSNIIDAVRWVMGESSARLLRGESMSDVIFSGSSARKPVGTATVELIFDNSDGTVQGEFASFSEISIKRQVSRDGQSAYFLNGTRCRRRDITDIFLGTGLGPRSYSIIEQGMISQIVEAKPEDLRHHLEEAAGISKYKERRRETEHRIRHTRENLDRLSDLREEVEKQLAHLNRQAKQAERYKLLKTEYRLKESQLLALKWRALKETLEQHDREVARAENDLEAQVSKLRALEAELEDQRSQQVEATEVVNAIQSELYAVGGDIARIEQDIAHRRDMREQKEREHREADQHWQELQEHIALDRVQSEELRQAIETLTPNVELAREEETITADTLQDAEQALADWQERWDAFSSETGNYQRTAEVEKTKIDHLDRQLNEQNTRLERLKQETPESELAQLREQEVALSETHEIEQSKADELDRQLADVKSGLITQNETVRNQRETLNGLREQYQQAKGRLSSLQALQQAALESGSDTTGAWISEHDLEKAKRLANSMKVDGGWEIAVETALAGLLEALVVESPDKLLAGATLPPDLDLSLVAAGAQVRGDSGLAAKVEAPKAIVDRLTGIIPVANVDAALSQTNQLAAHEYYITPEGICVGNGWLRLRPSGEGQDSVLAREREIAQLAESVDELREQGESLAETLQTAEKELAESEKQREEALAQVNMQHRRVTELAGQLANKKARIEQLSQRNKRIAEESAALQEQIAAESETVKASRLRLEESVDKMANLERQRAELEQQRRYLVAQRDQVRGKAREAREAAQKQAIELESRKASLRSTEQGLQRMQSQIAQIESKRAQLLDSLNQSDEPMEGEQQRLKALLEQKIAVEERLTEARGKQDQINAGLRQSEQQRQQIDGGLQNLRESLEKPKLANEASKYACKVWKNGWQK